MAMDGYELIDSGKGMKLERFGPYVLMRPCAQAIWKPQKDDSVWAGAHTTFTRSGGLQWKNRESIPESWVIEMDGMKFGLSGTDFGHVGVFPEQRAQWQWLRRVIVGEGERRGTRMSVLNLFAYSGGSTLAAALAGAEVCHLDASSGMVAWARENAARNGLDKAPVRWIVDDVHEFLKRELRRGRKYDAMILDPPSFGRGRRGEVYKIDRDLPVTLEMCRGLLSERPRFVLMSCHTPGYTPLILANLLRQSPGLRGDVESGEMILAGRPDVVPLPSGAYARWVAT